MTNTLSSKAQQATSRLPFMQGVRNALVFPLALIALPIAVSAKTFDEVVRPPVGPKKGTSQGNTSAYISFLAFLFGPTFY